MGLGNLSIKVGADISGYTSNMTLAATVAKDKMGASAGSVDEFRDSLLKASTDMQAFALSMNTNMEAANDAAKTGSEKFADALGEGIGVGIVAGQTAWDGFVGYVKTKAIIAGLAIATGVAAAVLTGVYAAYKATDFIVGLFTGESYKSASIDALIAINNQVKELQSTLRMTAQEASAVNAAIASVGVSKTDFTTVFTGAATAIRTNTEELDRLGVKYKDAQGNVLPLAEVVKNANKALGEYTEGWDRNQAASAMAMGSAAQVAAAATVTQSAIAEAGARLNDYNLGIGEESQAAVARYESAMRDFNRETELTSSGFKRAWADQIMPVLTDLAEYFKDGFPFAVNVFRYSMATITSLFYGLKTSVYIVGETIIGTISAIGSTLVGLAVASARVMTGDFSGAKDALVGGWTDAKARLGLIGDNIVAQARHNAAAMRQAWAMDDRADAPAPTPKTGKAWVAKPKEDDPAGPLDDVAKKIMEGALKAQEDFIADEQTQLQTRQQFLRHYYDEDSISAQHYYTTTQKLAADNLAATLDAYDKEIAAVRKYIEVHKAESDKQADIVAAENKIAELGRKRAQAEIQTNKDIALSYLDLSNQRRSIAQSLLKEDAAETKEYQQRMTVLRAFRDAQLENKVEGNRLLEKEEKRHHLAMATMQQNRDIQALDSVSSAASDMYAVLQNAGMQKTALAQSLFLVQKGIAIAEIIMNANLAASKAEGEFGPFGVPMATYLLATGYARAGIVAGTALAGAREKGGPVWSGASFLVGEKGPEIFTPSAGGTIIPNSEIGGGAKAGAGINITYAPNIQIDGSTDMARNKQMIASAVQQGNADLVDKLQRAGRI